jgi:hypothetical protein
MFPVRYELDLYILFRRNSIFKGLEISEKIGAFMIYTKVDEITICAVLLSRGML